MRTTLTTIAFAVLCLPVAAALAQTAQTAPPRAPAAGNNMFGAPKTPLKDSVYVGESKLRDIMQKSAAGFSTQLFPGTGASASFIRLAKADVPHAHGNVSEIFVVKEGSGLLETGGKITGITGTNSATHGDLFSNADGTARPAAAAPAPDPAAAARQAASGDLAGTDIEGGTRQEVKAGDVILVAAGVPHRWLRVDGSVVYLDIKFPKAQ